MTTSRRELILWDQFTNPYEHQASLFRSHEPHPTKANSGVTAGIVGEDNLIGRQRHSEVIREEDEGAWRAVSNNRKCRYPVWLPEEGRRRREVDEQRNVFHLALRPARRHSSSAVRRDRRTVTRRRCQRYCQMLWIGHRRDQAASFRSSSLLRSFRTPSMNVTPARTSGSRCAPFRRRHRCCAISRSL